MASPLFADLVGRDDCPPLVFKHATQSWPSASWTPQSLASALHDKQMQCKVAPRDVEAVQWETESLHVTVSLQQYADWLTGRPGPDNPLVNVDPAQFSCYIDYKYMKDMFADKPSFLKAVDWGVFGLKARDGEDSTIWIGSAGAYTPCHYDTYGFNLVAQLYGRKRWYLFSPAQTGHLYASRLPYEESSVFSQVNIRWPDLAQHPLLKGSTVYIVDLEPGDVLYVPRHWWHFVECLESSISVNTWITTKEDAVSQYHEAISRLLFTSMFTQLPGDTDGDDYVNTNEELQPVSVNLAYVNTSLKHLQTQMEESSPLTSGKHHQPCKEVSTQHKYSSNESSAELKHDSVNDNLEKFSAAFPDICVNTRSGIHGNCNNSSTKRKLEDDTIMKGNEFCKMQKSGDKVTGTDSSKTFAENLCCISECKGAVETRCKDNQVEISQCRKYSFEQYLSFLKDNYEYECDEIDNISTQSPSDKQPVTNAQREMSREITLQGEPGREVTLQGEPGREVTLQSRPGRLVTLEGEPCRDTTLHSVRSRDVTLQGEPNREITLQVKSSREVTLQDIINSVLQPEVVEHIAQVLQKRVCP